MDLTDLKSTLAYSMKYESAKTALKISMHARPIKIEDNTGEEKDDKFESLLRAFEKLLDRLEAGKKNAPRRNPNVTCWRCYKKGHVQRECPSDNASRRNPNVTCWSCNKNGHIQNECQQITSTNYHKGIPHGSEDALARRPCIKSCKRDLNTDKKFGMITDISMRALTMTTEDTWSSRGLFWYPRLGWKTSLLPLLTCGKSDVSQPNRGYQNRPASEIQREKLEDPEIRPIIEKKLKSANRPSRQKIDPESPATNRYWAL
ncbi:hypothetical protein AVEN_191129-1 [Araneus ventricosus]|uniref:CCHC-type domain-containing protein n=1 Tax=Araneus ventricosus TaxID=182803 RepID=A0A4Y2AYN0_ARAVE|nr:hypothetical protein AVEN_191129-1 [Araneus ventricosus]